MKASAIVAVLLMFLVIPHLTGCAEGKRTEVAAPSGVPSQALPAARKPVEVAAPSGGPSQGPPAAAKKPVGDGLLVIPLLTFQDASPWKTDLGSNFGLLLGPEEHMPNEVSGKPAVRQTLMWEKGNRYIRVRFERLARPHIFAGLWLSVFGHVEDRTVRLPAEVAERVDAVRFRAKAANRPVQFKLEAKTWDKEVASEQYFVARDQWQTFTLPLRPVTVVKELKELVFVIESRFQGADVDQSPSGALDLADVCLTGAPAPSLQAVPTEEELLDWTRHIGLRYFLWNYREPVVGRGFVLERNSFHDLVSIAGVGFAFPAIVVAEQEGQIPPDQARSRVMAMLRWIEAMNCNNGRSGLHGFPYHFLTPDGTQAGTSEVSTVDWALCAAGVRVVRQRYAQDPAIRDLAEAILKRPRWADTLSRAGRICHGFTKDGTPLSTDWGSSFTEEAYLVAVEAVASGGVDADVFKNLLRQPREGFWPSQNGSGFTYNWLQLWTGPREPFATNSIKAYARDAAFCLKRFGRPLLGLTACETFSGQDDDGFLKWDTYLGEIGSDCHMAAPGTVKHVAVCPYGAALALPFMRREATAALEEYVKLGAVHPLLGFPDSLRMEDLPPGADKPIPGWTQFAIDVGPMWMAAEACGPDKGRVAKWYLQDERIQAALARLDASLKGPTDHQP